VLYRTEITPYRVPDIPAGQTESDLKNLEDCDGAVRLPEPVCRNSVVTRAIGKRSPTIQAGEDLSGRHLKHAYNNGGSASRDAGLPLVPGSKSPRQSGHVYSPVTWDAKAIT